MATTPSRDNRRETLGGGHKNPSAQLRACRGGILRDEEYLLKLCILFNGGLYPMNVR